MLVATMIGRRRQSMQLRLSNVFTTCYPALGSDGGFACKNALWQDEVPGVPHVSQGDQVQESELPKLVGMGWM